MKGSGEAVINGRSVVDIRPDPRKDAKPDFSTGAFNENQCAAASGKPKELNTYSNIFEMIRQELINYPLLSLDCAKCSIILYSRRSMFFVCN